MDSFYSPLATTHHIRLLKLEKSSAGEVNGILEAVNLKTRPEYKCLSYTWGGPRWEDEKAGGGWIGTTQSVLINGHSLAIGLNLRNALDHLHSALGGKAIWIDAICINQGDALERNTQVALMGSIYEQADEVIVWLGKSTPTWETALENMKRLPLTRDELRMLNLTNLAKPMRDAVVACGLTSEEHADIIEFLSGIRWFSRIWTVQEQVFAREIRFLCGDILMLLETIWKGSLLMVTSGEESDLDVRRRRWNGQFLGLVLCRENLLPPPDDELVAIDERKETIRNMRVKKTLKASLGMQTHLHRSYLATDPKDKVFGVLSISRLTHQNIKEPFVVDYNLSVQQIYTKVAAWSLLSRGLEALCFVGDRTHNQIPDLPSWVPDFTQTLPWSILQWGGSRPTFKAASSLKTYVDLDSAEDGAIVLISSSVDSIVNTCDAYWHGLSGIGQGMSNFIKLLFRPSAPTKVYNEESACMILRLMVADGLKTRTDDPRKNQDLRDLFEQWLFGGFFISYEAHREQADSAILFWKDPESQLPSMAEALEIQHSLLEELLEPIIRGATQCKTIEDIELALLGRLQVDQESARYVPSPKTELATWQAHVGRNRRFFRTMRGYVGIGPRTMEPGDQVMLLQGASVPYLFRHRPEGPEDVFELVGEAYLHGFMYGEGLEKEDVVWKQMRVV